ncbi:MAG: class II fructose-bisphosphate aldolase [Thermodesulfovibrionales bacterium]|nr:class II fructose-bisphosphate aldolase [Thermodesulfovibrionales bacterium]
MEILDMAVYEAVFTDDEEKKIKSLKKLKEEAKNQGVWPASIKGLYETFAKEFPGFTVPAINIRGLTYDVARAAFKKAIEHKVGAVIFEIARSEIGYTKQRPLEYSAVILSAAVREGYRGPVFLQGDHFQIVKRNFEKDPEGEINYLKRLIKEAIEAEFYNIDIDSSTLVDLSRDSVYEQQRPNFEHTARLAEHIRLLEPEGISISIGGEIGEIGHKNSTPEELRAFLDGFNRTFRGSGGLCKISVQTGTSHGGVVLPDGSLKEVNIDFDTLRVLSDIARREYGLAGAVQHGASTLPENAFDMFPEVGTAEIHLATGFQNILYDSKVLPEEFRMEVYEYLKKEFASERKEGETDEQFIYKIRKKGFGSLKKRWWDLPEKVRAGLREELGDRFELLFKKLKVVNTSEIVRATVKR